MIGGAQGSGINSVAEAFSKACLRGGLEIFANIEYHSNIKGEHSFYRVRVEDKPVHSHLNWTDILIALDKETLLGDIHKAQPTHKGHIPEITPGSGGIIYDSDLKISQNDFGRKDIKLFPVPFKTLLLNVLKPIGKDKELSKYQVMVNTIAFGASIGLIEYDFDIVADVIRESFTGRKADLAELNVTAAKIGYDYVKQNFHNGLEYKLQKLENNQKRILMRGVQAVAIAKFKAGCAFQTYYPITPATDESEYLESNQKDYDIIVLQAEDEIAALNMATGAAHAGVRAASSTSGPGFSLMAEGLGWAGATEAPGPVIILYQRTGPSTGLPTRTEQGDLRFVLHASHGEFPRIVLAPGDVEECLYDTFEAFNLAEKFQVPVIVIADKHLASSYMSLKMPDTQRLKVDRGELLTEAELSKILDYSRYKHTESGISPRSLPGQKNGIFWASGEEHDEKGHLTEDAQNRTRMMKKRMRKILTADEIIPESMRVSLFGPTNADLTLVGWGSTKGPILDAMPDIEEEGHTVNFVQIRYMMPFPSKFVYQVLSKSKTTILVENNYSGQLGGLIRETCGIAMDHKVLKFDGRAFSQNDVYDGVVDSLKNRRKEVVVSYA